MSTKNTATPAQTRALVNALKAFINVLLEDRVGFLTEKEEYALKKAERALKAVSPKPKGTR